MDLEWTFEYYIMGIACYRSLQTWRRAVYSLVFVSFSDGCLLLRRLGHASGAEASWLTLCRVL